MPTERMCQHYQRDRPVEKRLLVQGRHRLADPGVYPLIGVRLLATAVAPARGQLTVTNRITQSAEQQCTQTSCPQIRRIIGRL